jgi:hypothetical protein
MDFTDFVDDSLEFSLLALTEKAALLGSLFYLLNMQNEKVIGGYKIRAIPLKSAPIRD